MSAADCRHTDTSLCRSFEDDTLSALKWSVPDLMEGAIAGIMCQAKLMDSCAAQAMPLEWPTSILTGGVFQVGQLPGASKLASVVTHRRSNKSELLLQRLLQAQVCRVEILTRPQSGPGSGSRLVD